MSLLAVRDLVVDYPAARAVDGLSFSVEAGQSVGLVGQSGSGKTQAGLAILGLTDRTAVVSGSVCLEGEELIGAPEKVLRKIRAGRIAMVFQDPLAALNPYRRIGDQLEAIAAQHRVCAPRERRARVLALLERTGLSDPEQQAAAYPHQLSGGMRQRVMIATALIAEPSLIIADEPTTALDATLQAQILLLLKQTIAESGVSLLLITHDLGVIAQASDKLVVVKQGQVVETGATAAVFAAPQHAETQRMLESARCTDFLAPDMRSDERSPLLELRGVSVSYTRRHGAFGSRSVNALHPTDVSLRAGETLAIVGESGSGKTSLARAALGLVAPASGTVCYLGKVLKAGIRDRRISDRRQLQLVFQDPGASLNPAMRVRHIVGEPLNVHRPHLDRPGRLQEVENVLSRVGLDKSLADRFPHQLSGGQAQRVAIARALVLKPSVLICDEAVASLDVSVRQDILRLLAEEQRRSALSIVFISHDLAVVRQLSRRVLVLYMGRVCETGPSRDVFARPLHPYTRGLIDSIAKPDPALAFSEAPLAGELPSQLEPPSGCVFHPRCRYAVDRCATEEPAIASFAGRSAACWRAAELDLSIEAEQSA